MKKYFIFKTKVLENVELPHFHDCSFSDIAVDGYYAIEVEKYSDFFRNTKDGVMPDFWEGWENYPKYSFDSEKYIAGLNPFIPFDYSNFECFKMQIRQKRIIRENGKYFGWPTELKRLRKMVKKLVQLLISKGEDLSGLEYDEFMEYSDTIESMISKHPKTSEYLDAIDLKKENGIES
jgi:hypothetical protein